MTDLMQTDFNPNAIQVKKGLTPEEAYKSLKNIDKEQVKKYIGEPDTPDDILTGNYRYIINNGNDLIYLTTHELGHVIAKNYEKRTKSNLYDAFIEEVNNQTGLKNYIKELGCKELGVYILESKGEFFAEAFADCIINKEKASKAGKIVPKFLKEKGII